MSNFIKISSAWLTVVVSSLGTAAYITWLASAKATAIETAQRDIISLQDSDKQQSAILNRLDERTVLILESLKSLARK
ncbi:hypothetical protein UFOVP674_28 [uncultured Caudovirales phage]|jgi:hypothetical protein|uniref:Uncharacterized protein n=1 Tax=uncultured Caudovirales phage TaxID=2100421 RepID=A0A6J5N7W3_9CAUD|nr:hypothetical protein UFOVP674_28 [uncultured Caudovirales phage]